MERLGSGDVTETVLCSDLQFTYARLGIRSGAERPTRTPQGQFGVSFSSHGGLVYEVDGRNARRDAPAGVAYLTGECAIDWVEVHGATEAVEIQIAEPVMRAAGAHRAANAYAVEDAVALTAASRLRAAYLSGAVSDVATSTVAHRLALHIAHRYAGIRLASVRQPRLSWYEVEAVHQFVRDNVDTTITIGDLAAVVHRSPFDFARIFREATGTTPHRFVTTVRIHRALDLLRSGRTVSASSASVGYTNRNHFRRQFRAVAGIELSHLLAS